MAIGLLLIGLGFWGGLHVWTVDHFRAANHALRRDRLDQALEHAQQYLNRWPADAEARLLLARIQRLRGNFPEVEKHLKECKRLQGMTERIQLEWSLLRCQAGELAPVEQGLVRCLQEKHPQSSLILEALAFSYMKELRYQAALGCLEEWVKQDPDNVRALDWRGWVHGKLELKEKAYEDYHKVLDLAPEHWLTRLRLAEMLLGDINTPEAAKHLDILIEDHGGNSEVALALAWCRHLQGRTDEAQSLLQDLLQKEPDNVTTLFYKGKLAAYPQEKEKWFRKVIAIEPGHVEAQYGLSTSLQQQGRAMEATAELARYTKMRDDLERLQKVLMPQLEKMPYNADLLVQVGEIFLTSNGYLGERFLQRALEAQPKHSKAHEILARYYQLKNEAAKAKHHREMAEASHAPQR
jgi:tetratricopeptide (TPR) repeat protein